MGCQICSIRISQTIKIKRLLMNSISNTLRLIHLILINNYILEEIHVVVDLDNNRFPSLKLLVLDLRNTNLKTIDPTSFHSLIEGLLKLDLSYISIKIISVYMFQNLYKLQILNLELNLISNLHRISVLSLNALVELRKLKVLNLQNNSISMSDRYSFSTLSMLYKWGKEEVLYKLDIRYCQISK